MATNKVGFIKQPRSIMNEVIWVWPAVRLKIYMTIYLMANYSPNQWTFRGTTYSCEPGETVTSYGNIVKECKSSDITLKIVKTTCRLLEDEGYISIEPNYKKNIKIKLLEWNQTQRKKGERDQFGDQLRDQFGDQNETAESVDNKGQNQGEENERDQLRDQLRDQKRDTIEEVKEYKEEEEEDHAANSTEKEPDQVAGSEIVNLYYKLYREYLKTEPNVNKHRDNNLLSKYPAIQKDDINKVTEKLKGWFIDIDDWKEKNNFPFAAFLKQYDDVREVTCDRPLIMIDTCNKCHRTIYEGKDHECTFFGHCEDCNVGWTYKANEPEREIHDCMAYKERLCEEMNMDCDGGDHIICPECKQVIFRNEHGVMRNHQCGDRWFYNGEYYDNEQDVKKAEEIFKEERRKQFNIEKKAAQR